MLNLYNKGGWCMMEREISINLEEEMFQGNILDIGYNNYGVIYNLCKNYENEIAVDYVSSKDDREIIQEDFYDNCVMLFSLNSIWLTINKRSMVKEISKYLKKDGFIYLWDIDKGYAKIFNEKIKIMLPDRGIKEITIRDYNFLKDNSMQNSVKIIEEYFKIIDLKYNNNIYYIKASSKK